MMMVGWGILQNQNMWTIRLCSHIRDIPNNGQAKGENQTFESANPLLESDVRIN